MNIHSFTPLSLRRVLLLAALLGLPLTGCGGGSGADTSRPGEQTTADSEQVQDVLSTSGLSVGDVSVMAGEPEAWFTLELDPPAKGPVSVRYRTEDGTATARVDYVHAAGDVSFAAGEVAKHVVVKLLDSTPEEKLAFSLRLSSPQGASLADGRGEAYIAPLLQEAGFDANWADTGAFSSANSCATCHSGNGEVMTHAGQDVSPPDLWKHSMMGQSFNDPYFQAALAEETHLFPELAGTIEDTCLTCHAPMGRTHAHQTGDGLDGDGNYRLASALRQMHAREGVSCTACHQIQDDGRLGTAQSFSGQYSLGSGQIFGPYPDPTATPMQNRTQYTPVFSEHMRASAMCATCHTLFTPVIDINTGRPNGRSFPEQTPYLEWRNSVYGPGRAEEKACQACHMPVPSDTYSTQIATRPDGNTNANFPSRSPFRTHTFTGGNAHTLELLAAYRGVLGIETSTTTAGFDAAIERTRRQLAEDTADLVVGALRVDEADRLSVPVTIINRTGHKLPTAYPSRRMWLHLRVTDRDGRVVFESGQPDPNGRISVDATHLSEQCLASKKNTPVTGCFEPHRQTIEHPGQVAVYESVLGDVNGNISYVLLHASQYLKDNRLPPRGFERSAIPSDGTTAIIGAAERDTDFNRTSAEGSGSDTVHYRIDTGDAQGPFQVQARLLYQAVRPSFINSLHADDARVERYKHMVKNIPPSVEELARAHASY